MSLLVKQTNSIISAKRVRTNLGGIRIHLPLRPLDFPQNPFLRIQIRSSSAPEHLTTSPQSTLKLTLTLSGIEISNDAALSFQNRLVSKKAA